MDFLATLTNGSTISVRRVNAGQEGWLIDTYRGEDENGDPIVWNIDGTPTDSNDPAIIAVVEE